MSRAQEHRRCPTHGIVSAHHRCQQRPQAKMRGPTSGLSTGPAWDSARWAAHLRAKVEAGAVAKPVAASSGIDHGGIVLAGDVWVGPAGNLLKHGTLLSRAQKAERVPGELRVGDECRLNDMGESVWAKARLRLTSRVINSGRVLWKCELMHYVNASWKRGDTTPVEAHRLELVEPVKEG